MLVVVEAANRHKKRLRICAAFLFNPIAYLLIGNFRYSGFTRFFNGNLGRIAIGVENIGVVFYPSFHNLSIFAPRYRGHAVRELRTIPNAQNRHLVVTAA